MTDTIFNPDELEADAIVADDAPESQESQADAPARDEHGRFAPKSQDEPEPDAEEPEAGQRQVPQGALHAEREKHKTTKAELQAAQAQLQQFQQLREQIAARKPAEQPPVIGDGSQNDYLRERVAQIEGTQHRMVQSQQLHQVEFAERQQLHAVLSQSEAEFRASKPDYDEAINHVVSARAQELALYGLNAAEVQQAIQHEVLDITRSAIQQGRAPAEVAYQLATLRGYRGGAQQQQQPGAAQRVVEAVGAARATSRSLGQASGTGATRDLNASTIAAMSGDEFEALYSTPEGKRLIDAL